MLFVTYCSNWIGAVCYLLWSMDWYRLLLIVVTELVLPVTCCSNWIGGVFTYCSNWIGATYYLL